MSRRLFLAVVALFASIASVGSADSYAVDQMQDAKSGLPNVSARFHPNSTTFTAFADLLVWRVTESGSENWAEVITTKGSTTTSDIRDVAFGWDPGFRVGVGYGMRHDQWDTRFYYTWFKAHTHERVSSSPGSVFSAFIGNFYVDNPAGAGISGIAYQKASIDWTMRFNIFDWELGRAFWVSKALSLRPFIGIKGGWIHQSMDSKWEHPTLKSGPVFDKATENLKNNFWGIGPSGGLNTKWNLLTRDNHAFGLFGDFSGAIMWGHWTFGDVYKNDAQQEVDIVSSHISSAASMLRSFTGFEWDVSGKKKQFHFAARLGYEMQFWLDQLQFYSFDTGRLSNELTLQGGTLEFLFDF